MSQDEELVVGTVIAFPLSKDWIALTEIPKVVAAVWHLESFSDVFKQNDTQTTPVQHEENAFGWANQTAIVVSYNETQMRYVAIYYENDRYYILVNTL